MKKKKIYEVKVLRNWKELVRTTWTQAEKEELLKYTEKPKKVKKKKTEIDVPETIKLQQVLKIKINKEPKLNCLPNLANTSKTRD